MKVAGLLRDIVLIPLPLGLLTVAFFIAGIVEAGVVMLLFTLAAIWFIRPRRATSVAAGVPTKDDDGLPDVPVVSGPPT